MLNFWDYSPVTGVTFLSLSEHSGSESAAGFDAAALGASLPGLPAGTGTARGLATPQAPSTQGWRTWQQGGYGSTTPGRDFR